MSPNVALLGLAQMRNDPEMVSRPAAAGSDRSTTRFLELSGPSPRQGGSPICATPLAFAIVSSRFGPQSASAFSPDGTEWSLAIYPVNPARYPQAARNVDEAFSGPATPCGPYHHPPGGF
jgi:hypothetical protein